MEKEQLKELMTDIDNNEVTTIKQKIADEMKSKILNEINAKRKEVDDDTIL